MAGPGVEVAVVGENPNQHHRAGHGSRSAKHDARGPAVSGKPSRGQSHQDGDATCHESAGNRHATHLEELADVEIQADPKHQQDHADLGKLLGEPLVGLKTG